MALILNILVPGAGLILRKREWLGLSLALLFAICGNLAIAGSIIAPAAMPIWLTTVSLALAVIVWAASQLLCHRQGRWLRESAAHIHTIYSEALEAIKRNDPDAAHIAIEAIEAVDPECNELRLLRNQLHESPGPAIEPVD